MNYYDLSNYSRFIPIRFYRDDGQAYDAPPGRPVVRAVLMYDPDHGSGPRHIKYNTEVFALIDTGADQNYATPKLIETAKCLAIKPSMVRSATEWKESTHYHCHIFFPESGLQIETDVHSADLTDNDSDLPLIIGNLVLNKGALILDSKSNIYRFYTN